MKSAVACIKIDAGVGLEKGPGGLMLGSSYGKRNHAALYIV